MKKQKEYNRTDKRKTDQRQGKGQWKLDIWLTNIRGIRSNIGKLDALIAKADPKPDLIMKAEYKLDSVNTGSDPNMNLTRRDRKMTLDGWLHNLLQYHHLSKKDEGSGTTRLRDDDNISRVRIKGKTLPSLLYIPPDNDNEAIRWHIRP